MTIAGGRSSWCWNRVRRRTDAMNPRAGRWFNCWVSMTVLWCGGCHTLGTDGTPSQPDPGATTAHVHFHSSVEELPVRQTTWQPDEQKDGLDQPVPGPLPTTPANRQLVLTDKQPSARQRKT